jgi:hypothetical protein
MERKGRAMKKFTIEVETNGDLFDMAKIISRFEKIGVLRLVSIIQEKDYSNIDLPSDEDWQEFFSKIKI